MPACTKCLGKSTKRVGVCRFCRKMTYPGGSTDMCPACSTSRNICLFCGDPLPRTTGRLAMMGSVSVTIPQTTLHAPLPRDPLIDHNEWRSTLHNARFTDQQLLLPPVRLAILRQVHRMNEPPNTLPSPSTLGDMEFLVRDLSNLNTALAANLPKLICKSGHTLKAMSNAELVTEKSAYSTGFHCDLCGSDKGTGEKAMHCARCGYDLCSSCALSLLL
ncbi:hypothetical protein Pelo_4055 [Pelomyxa schiedti]|nr:hypothetical protein Pelo_4055 [Pelomyxa schiedti]